MNLVQSDFISMGSTENHFWAGSGPIFKTLIGSGPIFKIKFAVTAFK